MRKPEDIPNMAEIQIFAYYKSFLETLDNSDEDVNDYNAEFIESCLHRGSMYTEKQLKWIQDLMDKYPKCYPKFEHYKSSDNAIKYLY